MSECSSPYLWIHCLLAIGLLVMAVAFMAHFSNNILLEYDEEVGCLLHVALCIMGPMYKNIRKIFKFGVSFFTICHI